jgi:methyl-accepting chemotaxis protein
MEGILISGPDAESCRSKRKLQRHAAGHRRLQDPDHRASKAGAQARFERPDARLREKIEDKLWSIHDENTEFVTRAMEAGAALTKIFENGVASGAISIEDMFDTDYVEIPAPIRCSTAPKSWTGPTARCRRSRKRSWPRIRAWRSAP